MRDFSKVSPTIWRSRKFRSLSSDGARMLYLYLLTCPHGNSAGCFDLHPMYACADLGWSEDAYREAIESLSIADLVMVDWAENTLWIVNWDEFNEPTNPKHAIGLLTQLDQASSVKLKSVAFQAFIARFKARKFDQDTSLRKAIEILSKAYREAITTETETESEMETEMETRPDQTETETRSPLRSAPPETGAQLAAEQADPGPIPPHLRRLPPSQTGTGPPSPQLVNLLQKQGAL